ncbi:MAG: division/cell wall cluster transcriptional repressor MraZ [Desulfobacterales bacterium]
MFRGNSFHTIDPKGRIIIPSRFRDVIRAGGGQGVMISRRGRGLFVYTYDEWAKIEGRVLALAEKSDEMDRFIRTFIGGAFDCPCDKQDRVLVPAVLRTYAELDKEIAVVGVLRRFEIWSRENWEMEIQQQEEDIRKEDVRSEIARLGL